MKNQDYKLTFQEIMAYGPDNEAVFAELVKLVKAGINNLLPFVGAGLSTPIYPLWGAALRKIGENFRSQENRDQLEAYLKEWDYLGAAEFLEQKRKPTNLARDFEKLFSPEKLSTRIQEIREMPVWLLPMLFKGNAITTNLDRMLEYVYENQGLPFNTICLPGERAWLFNAAIKAPDAHNLYKLHGSVEADGRLSYDKVVFTETQYDKNYTPDSDLVKVLSSTLEKKTLLFLGCSLEQDRTLDIINQVKEPGTEHYAILPCKEADLDDRIGFLGDLHIRAIFYPDGKFEAVRILLEQLLAETDPDAYHNLPLRVGAEAEKTREERFNTRFQYDAGLFSPVDRPELANLEAFLADEAGFRWWAIVGPGGVGKSRLALTLVERLPEGWSARFLSRNNYTNNFRDITAQGQNLLFIADYVQAYTDKLGNWIDWLAGMPWGSRKIRLLLLEREGGDWEERLRKCFAGKPTPETAEFRREKGFLTLEALGEDALLTLMERFSEAVKPLSEDYTRTWDRNAGKKLLEALEQVDPQLRRPLFSLFLTDSWLMGQDPETWNRESLLGEILDKEERYIRERIALAVSGVTKQLECDVMWVLRAATVLQDADTENLKELYPGWTNLTRRAKEKGFLSADDLLCHLGLCCGNMVQALRPDILGEYFVLRWLLGNHDTEACREFLNTLWTRGLDSAVFWDRVIYDYNDVLDREASHWEAILPNIDGFFADDAIPFAMWLANATAETTKLHTAETLVSRLEALAKGWPRNQDYFRNIANVMVKQNSKQGHTEATVKRKNLEDLARALYGDPQLLLQLSRGLVNLSEKQEAADATATINRLEALAIEWAGAREITLEFAKGLAYLISKQEAAQAAITFNRLEVLVQEWPGDREIVLELVIGLVNLINKQEIADDVTTANRLEALMQEWHGDREIVLKLAMGLVNLINKQETGEATIINRLETLAHEWPKDREIMQMLAKGLFNFSNMQETAGATTTINHLEALAQEWPSDREIALALAKGLFNLSIKQETSEAAATINRLEALVQAWAGDWEIALALAKGLVILSSKQVPPEMITTVKRLETLAQSWPDNLEIMLHFAMGVFISGTNQRFLGYSPESVIIKLKNLEKQWEGRKLLQLAAATLQLVLKAYMDGDAEQGQTYWEQFRLIQSQIAAESQNKS